MPNTLFLQILNMSFTASFVILAVLAVRLLLKKAPRVISYGLWAVVLFRLICPVSFESTFSLLPVNVNPIPQEMIYGQTPQMETEPAISVDGINAALPHVTPASGINSTQLWIDIGTFLWLCGIAALLVYSVVTLFILSRRLRGAVCESGNVYLAEGLASPFVMGLFPPKIYLPAHLAEEEKQYILLHEQTHIKRLDHVVKIVSFFVLCLHWFNPLVWVAFFLCGKDMEMSCDEAVIKNLGNEVKKDYSASLLTLATGRRIVGGSPLAFGEGDTKGRIKNVLNYKKPAFWVIVLSVAVVAVVGIGLAANPKSDRASMQWAKDLRVEDVAKIELVAMPREPDKVYRLFDSTEFSDIVALVNESHGNYLGASTPKLGGSITFYITMKDGVRHYFRKGGSGLIIDGDHYEIEKDWLSAWESENGNTSLPLNFSLENKKPLTLDELKTIAKKGDRISWEDFAPYDGSDVGSGLYIMHYPMAEPYYVSVGGIPNETPQYVALYSTKTEKGIDIRWESIDDFIQSTEANTLSDLRPMLMINGDLYLDTGKESPMGATAAVDSTIKTTVDQNARPTENEQSNFGSVGSSYVIDGDSVFVNIADKWVVFEKEKSPIKDDFTAVTITAHENGIDNVQVKITDGTMINQLRSLLLIGELTDMESVNDAPNKSDYIHITFEDGNEPLHCYVYVKYGKYYIERPYNGIWEISVDTYNGIGAIVESIALPPQQALIDSYYAGQGM